MSKKFWSALVAFSVGSFLSSCNFASPETYFDEAVLNVNLITPFGGQAALNSLAQPSVKLVPGTKDQAAPMARKEIVENQIQNVEANLGKIKALPDSEEPGTWCKFPSGCTSSFSRLIKLNIWSWQSFTMKAGRKGNDS
jgi:hypothetical protein